MAQIGYYARLGLLILLFWAAILRSQMLTPAFEGPDEPQHFGYVTELLRTGHAPDASRSMQNLALQESGQAPLQYVLAAAWARLAPGYTWDGTLPANPWHRFEVPLPAADNPNYFMFGPDQLPYAAQPGIEPALRWARWLAAFEGLIALALVYAGARRLVRRAWALWAALLFAFNPVVIQLSAILNNDTAGLVLGAACAYRLITLAQNRLTPRRLLISGLVIALGMLGKLSLLVFVPTAVLLIAAREWRKPRLALGRWVWLMLPVLLIGGAWYGGSALAYGDWSGIQPHLRMGWALDPPRSLGDILRDPVPFHTLWSGGTWGEVSPGDWVFIPPLILIALAALGYARRRPPRAHRLATLALALICLGVLIGLLSWLTRFTSVTGRLFMAGYPALALVVTVGLAYGWGWRAGRMIRLVGGSLVVFSAVIITLHVTLAEAFTTITFPPEAAPPLLGTPLQFGEARLLGYQLEPATLAAHQTPRALLCWQSTCPTGRLPMPYAFAFQLGSQGDIYFARDSYPGMGSYTFWGAGLAFCDRFTLAERRALEAGRAYRVAIQLYNPQTRQSLTDDQKRGPFIGWVAAPGPRLTEAERQAAHYAFGGLLLLDTEVKAERDAVELKLAWGTGGWRATNVTLFIHLMRGAELVGQLDTPLGGERYPAGLWGADERTITETYRLPLQAQLVDQQTAVYIGVYNTATGDRLPATAIQGDPTAVQDNRVRLPFPP